MRLCIRLVLLFSAAQGLYGQTPEPPRVMDDSMEVGLFAAEPMIQQPVGCAIDKHGRLLVIESHTHFRPKDWQGPEHDQVVILTDKDGDGRADDRHVLFDQTDMTMDIAVHPDGAIYLAARDEILRLRDDDGDGKVEKVERRLVWMESEGRYPHNGLSGLAFDAKGGLYFGMGENLGFAYTLKGSDGSSHSDQGEGGNIWHVTADGARLRRVATGFWNPFGVCLDAEGNVFATDNDPSSSPPCRLHHIIEGGDHGYQFRYGRSGLHPFVSWSGQRLGTLPMLAGTGEAPCDLLHYPAAPHPAYRGLPEEWAGTLLVASWVDHRVESHRLKPGKGTFTSTMKPLLEGGADFRPVAFAVAADGTLFVTDWVKRDYELHGKGRVWRIAAKQPRALTGTMQRPPAEDADAQLRAAIATGPAPSLENVIAWLARADAPYLFSAALDRLAREPALVRELIAQPLPDARLRAAALLATRRIMTREGLPAAQMPSDAARLLARSLKDADPQVLLIALHWISDERIARFKILVEELLDDPALSAELLYAAITALVRIESETAGEEEMVARLKASILDPRASLERVRMAARVLPDVERNVKPDELAAVIRKTNPRNAEWLAHLVGLIRGEKSQAQLRALVLDETMPPTVRAAALDHLEATPEDADVLVQALSGGSQVLRRAALAAFIGLPLPSRALPVLQQAQTPELAPLIARLRGQPFFGRRPPLNDVKGWRAFLAEIPGKPDLNRGRQVFLSSRLGGCAACHSKDGLGSAAGPDLDHIAAAADPDYALTSLLQPNANISPQFESFTLTTTDGQTRTLFQLAERAGTHTYIDISGKTHTIKIEEILRRTRLPVSIMPEGIVMRLTDTEVRDLLAYLEQKQP